MNLSVRNPRNPVSKLVVSDSRKMSTHHVMLHSGVGSSLCRQDRNFPSWENVSESSEGFTMDSMLSYPETRLRDSGLFDFLVDLVGVDTIFDLVLELLICFLEVL